MIDAHDLRPPPSLLGGPLLLVSVFTSDGSGGTVAFARTTEGEEKRLDAREVKQKERKALENAVNACSNGSTMEQQTKGEDEKGEGE